MQEKNSVAFSQILTSLLDQSKVFPPSYLNHFSDITPAELASLKEVWFQVPESRRLSLVQDMEQLAETDTLVCFDDLGRFALTDTDPQVRTAAISLLWECDDHKLVPRFIEMLKKDDDLHVRAAAASALGLFVYLGELEEISVDLVKKIEEMLLPMITGKEPPLVRRRALESMGYSSRPEMNRLIQQAYDSNDPDWQGSALFAMGRSANSHWKKQVITMLNNPDSAVQLEAVRAAGQLEISGARKALREIIQNQDEADPEVLAAAVWSLSQIGGEGVRSEIESLLERLEDDEAADFIEDALENLNFTEDLSRLSILEVEPEDEDDLDTIVDFDDEDGEEDLPGIPPAKPSRRR